jgi:ABC-type transporter Mla subunit MlaD
MTISDRDIQKLLEQVRQSDEALKLCADQLQKIAVSQGATSEQLARITALLQAMNTAMDGQDERIARNSQDIAIIKKHLGI